MPGRPQPLVIPDSTRFTIMLFPPYGLAWLWLNKTLDKERKIFGSIGMALYTGLWLLLVGFVLYFFTPLGVGEDLWKAEDTYNRGDMLENLRRKQKIKELEKELQELKKQEGKQPNAMLHADGVLIVDSGTSAWSNPTSDGVRHRSPQPGPAVTQSLSVTSRSLLSTVSPTLTCSSAATPSQGA